MIVHQTIENNFLFLSIFTGIIHSSSIAVHLSAAKLDLTKLNKNLEDLKENFAANAKKK